MIDFRKMAESMVANSLEQVQTLGDLSRLDEVVDSQIGELSLSFKGEHRQHHFIQTLREIVHAYVRMLAEQKFTHV